MWRSLLCRRGYSVQHQPTAYIRAETNEIHDALALFGQNRDTQIMVGQILPRLFLYGPKAKNVFYIFKGLKKGYRSLTWLKNLKYLLPIFLQKSLLALVIDSWVLKWINNLFIFIKSLKDTLSDYIRVYSRYYST